MKKWNFTYNELRNAEDVIDILGDGAISESAKQKLNELLREENPINKEQHRQLSAGELIELVEEKIKTKNVFTERGCPQDTQLLEALLALLKKPSEAGLNKLERIFNIQIIEEATKQ